jgi:peptidoglycan/LPS O-acetylase OafA/YrhL
MPPPSSHGDDSSRHAMTGRIPVLDGLRALSIVLVLAAHLLPLGPKAWALNATAGAMGMSLFFALSGFLIVGTLRNSDVLTFAVHRLARLLPLAWLYILVVWLCFSISAEALMASFGLYLNYRPDLMLPVTEHLWSLGVEIHFYLAIGLVALINRRAVAPACWCLCLGVTLLRVLEGAHLSIATHLRVDEILAGACVATLSSRHLARMPASGRLWLGLAVLWCIASHPGSGALQFLRPAITGLLLAATLQLPGGVLRQALGASMLRTIATMSYALYVIHPLTAHGWWNAGSIAERYLFKRPLGFAITIILAHLSSVYWERMWMRMARHWLAKRQAPPALGSTALVQLPRDTSLN